MDKKIIDYDVVPTDMVVERIKNGWQPYGNMVIEYSNKKRLEPAFWQPMVKYREPSKIGLAKAKKLRDKLQKTLAEKIKNDTPFNQEDITLLLDFLMQNLSSIENL